MFKNVVQENLLDNNIFCEQDIKIEDKNNKITNKKNIQSIKNNSIYQIDNKKNKNYLNLDLDIFEIYKYDIVNNDIIENTRKYKSYLFSKLLVNYLTCEEENFNLDKSLYHKFTDFFYLFNKNESFNKNVESINIDENFIGIKFFKNQKNQINEKSINYLIKNIKNFKNINVNVVSNICLKDELKCFISTKFTCEEIWLYFNEIIKYNNSILFYNEDKNNNFELYMNNSCIFLNFKKHITLSDQKNFEKIISFIKHFNENLCDALFLFLINNKNAQHQFNIFLSIFYASLSILNKKIETLMFDNFILHISDYSTKILFNLTGTKNINQFVKLTNNISFDSKKKFMDFLKFDFFSLKEQIIFKYREFFIVKAMIGNEYLSKNLKSKQTNNYNDEMIIDNLLAKSINIIISINKNVYFGPYLTNLLENECCNFVEYLYCGKHNIFLKFQLFIKDIFFDYLSSIYYEPNTELFINKFLVDYICLHIEKINNLKNIEEIENAIYADAFLLLCLNILTYNNSINNYELFLLDTNFQDIKCENKPIDNVKNLFKKIIFHKDDVRDKIKFDFQSFNTEIIAQINSYTSILYNGYNRPCVAKKEILGVFAINFHNLIIKNIKQIELCNPDDVELYKNKSFFDYQENNLKLNINKENLNKIKIKEKIEKKAENRKKNLKLK